MAANTSDNLSPKQEEAIVALLNEPTVAKAAAACEVGERTLYRWLDEPPFSAAYRKARREAFAQAIGLVRKYTPLAVNTLAKILVDPVAPHSARVSAATAMLKFSRESLELDDLAARVAALEGASADEGEPV